METIYVKPADNLQVRDPRTGEPIPTEGRDVPRTRYWLRRLRDGDVTEAQPPKASKAKTSDKE